MMLWMLFLWTVIVLSENIMLVKQATGSVKILTLSPLKAMSSSITVTLVKFSWFIKASSIPSNDLTSLLWKFHDWNFSVCIVLRTHLTVSLQQLVAIPQYCQVFVWYPLLSLKHNNYYHNVFRCILTIDTSGCDRLRITVGSDNSVAVWVSIVDTILILSEFWSAVSVALITRSIKLSDTDMTLSTVMFAYW